jgi:hypothetical protein
MAAPKDFDELIDAVLLLAETRDASPFIAVISDATVERFLCFGKKDELIEGLTSEFWKSNKGGTGEGTCADSSPATPLTLVRSFP